MGPDDRPPPPPQPLLSAMSPPPSPPLLRALPSSRREPEESPQGSQGSEDSFCRAMGLLGMGHRLFVPKLLATSKEDLLQADFEGALKFFRVQLPKRYRAAENARRLMEQACNIKVRPHGAL
uniref:Uncharacterized protein n=1 Tax=Knipowitschia caucasica TaxID=637954 RepID=A0AAV2KRC4_KNICA